MENQTSNPPWRKPQGGPGYRPTPSIPRKRPADSQEQAWVAGEDRFVLQQAKKKAEIRVKECRAKPIDWLAVTLRFIDRSRNPFEDEIADSELDVVDPEGVFESLDEAQLAELEKDIDVYITLESNETNKDFWDTMLVICKDRRQKAGGAGREGRGLDSVSSDVDRLLSTKSFDELKTLEKQIRTKLKSNEPIDVEYWEHMLRNLISWKARAKLRNVSQVIIDSQLEGLRQQQDEEAQEVREKISELRKTPSELDSRNGDRHRSSGVMVVDPEPALRIESSDKGLDIQDETVFLDHVASERRRVVKLGYVPSKTKQRDSTLNSSGNTTLESTSGPTGGRNEESSRATTLLYEREVARGVGENEEIFTAEEEVVSNSNKQQQWANKHKPRKPRYFNRVQMGYEWNKYNQTHYDHDNPPPKVVQGYKFNILYPDLIDKRVAPTYKIERENGRKRGQSFAPAGEEDTCLIRFIAGPPYEDIAYRIVDKEWDYSAKRERGFRSSFDKGVLQLHFQFKKIFYRK